MSSRRTALGGLTLKTLQPERRPGQVHAGLWLDRFLSTQDREDTNARRSLVEEVASIPVSQAYGLFFARWQAALAQSGAVVRRGQVQNRLVVGLGGESALETHITLHRTYGVPLIPGPALKGLAASYARNHLGPTWKEGSEAYQTLFGDTTSAGFVTFFDALPCVETDGTLKHNSAHPLHAQLMQRRHSGSLLEPDILTVHHPKYYMGEEARGPNGARDGIHAPADWDSPNPVSFLSAVGTYLLALKGPAEWVESAFQILTQALSEEGVGAKTSSGYGRLTLLD